MTALGERLWVRGQTGGKNEKVHEAAWHSVDNGFGAKGHLFLRIIHAATLRYAVTLTRGPHGRCNDIA